MKMIDGVLKIQQGLAELGYDPGPLDGLTGDKTLGALDAARAVRLAPKPAAVPPPASVAPQSRAFPAQSGVAAFYGPAGARECTAGSVALPFPFQIAWDASQMVSRFSCHLKVAAPLSKIFSDAAAHYGEAEFRRLRLDRFGGCYNYRTMRGGSSLSMHAWGIAVDLDPERNQLSWGADRAAFAQPEYLPFWSIVEAAGATSLGRRKNYDWQHFQFASV